MSQGFTLWFTGLSGAGKTTLTEALVPQLAGARRQGGSAGRRRSPHQSEQRDWAFPKKTATRTSAASVMSARLLSRNGVGVIAAAISPYREIRDEVRAGIEG